MANPTAASFHYVGGNPALDLVNTVDWTDHGLVHERLSNYTDLVRWAEGAGVVDAAAARLLRQRATRSPGSARRTFLSALRVRQALRLVVSGVAAPKSVVLADRRAALESLNASLKSSLTRLRLQPGARQMSLSWRDFGSDLESPIWSIVWSAAQLLASNEADRLRICDGENCGWVYVDRSRNGLRRWCEMATCGTTRKTQRRRARNHARR